MEILAIRRAGTILVQKGIEHFVIFTDSPDAVVRAGVEAVRWTPRSQNYAGFLLERLMRRGQYLRQSRRRVKSRRTNAALTEILEMLTAEKYEFQLSKSLVWKGIQLKHLPFPNEASE